MLMLHSFFPLKEENHYIKLLKVNHFPVQCLISKQGMEKVLHKAGDEVFTLEMGHISLHQADQQLEPYTL